MLKLKYLYENFDLARKCMELYDYDIDSAEEMMQYFRISSNAIYPFRLKQETDKICFLRLSPAEEKKLSDVETELCLLEWLREQGFPAMHAVSMKDGRLFGQMHTEWGTYNVSCFERVQGDSLEDTQGNPTIIEGYGRTLGELHALMKKYPYPETRRSHSALLEEIEERMQKYGASDTVWKEFSAVCRELDKLDISKTNYGVIHYDFEADNVFYSEQDESFHVIDFDDAICCWYALDVVRALDALEEISGNLSMEEKKQCFLSGYQSVTALTQEQLQSIPFMRRLVHLQEYATLLHVLGEEIQDMPDWMKMLCEKLNNKLIWIEKNMDKDIE